MWLTALWILFSVLGASVGQDDHSNYGLFSPPDESEHIVRPFLKMMSDTIQTRRWFEISYLFTNGFMFKNCGKILNKDHFVEDLAQIPSGSFKIWLISSKFSKFSAGKILFKVLIRGLSSSKIEARFTLSHAPFYDKISDGYVYYCNNPDSSRLAAQDNSPAVVSVGQDQFPFHGIGYSSHDSSEPIVRTFLKRMNDIIETGNPVMISDLFTYGFTYHNCHNIRSKADIVDSLTKMPPGYFEIVYESSEFSGNQINFISAIKYTGEIQTHAFFILNKKDQQLKSGDAFCLVSQ
uniref:FBA_2 domain-containing protein n=1 Tax=Caenorhabditis tropicalis TaxID=1561998 RepID=A0A1I7UPK0_9PELO